MENQQKLYERKSCKILPGYPWKGKYGTKEEIEAYFAGREIQCLLCGHWFKQITPVHLASIHGATADEYRKRYGLPLSGEMSGKLTGKGRKVPDEEERARKWRRKDYETILQRMRDQKRVVSDVCNDPDTPGITSWFYYARKHPEFGEKARRIHYSLSYPTQIKNKDISPRFRLDCQRLRARGMSREKIANTLGVSSKPVKRVLRDYDANNDVSDFAYPRKVRRDVYEKTLERMRVQGRTLTDVCKDVDLPSMKTCKVYSRRRPDFLKKVHRLHHKLPYATQLAIRDVSPQFRVDCQRLRARNMGLEKIASILGVSKKAVSRVLRDFDFSYDFHGPLKWRRKDYEAVLDKMSDQKRTFTDVCGDPGMPSAKAWALYAKSHPEFAERAREIQYSLPYPLQFQSGDVSPKFRVECRRMREEGMSSREIAKALGVSANLVRKETKKIYREMGLPEILPAGQPKKWSMENYEAILDRMLEQKRPLSDVCNDPDLPSRESWQTFSKKHPEFAMLARQVHYGLPYSEQHRIRVVSPDFRLDCRRLQDTGMPRKKIAETLGVSPNAVIQALRNKRSIPL